MKLNAFFLTLFIGLLSFSFHVHAQNPKAPTLEIILSDHQPLQISVNGRMFRNVSRKLNLRDLPSGRNYIEVYRYSNPDGKNKSKKSVVFSGYIRLKRGQHYQGVVLVEERKLRLSDKNDLFQEKTPHANIHNMNKDVPLTVNPSFEETVELKQNASSSIINLGERMNKMDKDEDRYNTAINFVNKRKNTVDELKVISSWLLFDETKLKFFKYSYANTTDQYNFHLLRDVFTMKKEQDAFIDFVNRN